MVANTVHTKFLLLTMLSNVKYIDEAVRRSKAAATTVAMKYL
jgi:hypothetical protein